MNDYELPGARWFPESTLGFRALSTIIFARPRSSLSLEQTKTHRRGAEGAEEAQRVERIQVSAPPLRPLRLCGELLSLYTQECIDQVA